MNLPVNKITITFHPEQGSLTSTDRDWTPPAPRTNWPWKLPEALVPEDGGLGAASSSATPELALPFLTCGEEEFGTFKKEA